MCGVPGVRGGGSVQSSPIEAIHLHSCHYPPHIYAICHAQVFLFGDQCILHEPPEKWPYCDALVAFYSTGFPLDKARAGGVVCVCVFVPLPTWTIPKSGGGSNSCRFLKKTKQAERYAAMHRPFILNDLSMQVRA